MTASYLRKHTQKALWLLIIIFITMNIVAFAHAYKFTHFSEDVLARTKDPKELSWFNKVNILFTGIDNPRPRHKIMPSNNFNVVTIGDSLRCWNIKVQNSKGTVILFHGYAGEKSSLIGRADYFRKLGYTTLLVDFLGSGDSEGSSTSVGYHEAEQVKICYDHVLLSREENILLFGTSMGAAAILKAIKDYKILPKAIVLECPFGSLYNTVCARFNIMNLPAFPMAALLTFWGGVQHGYWAFSHNPSEYARSVNCTTLLLYGEQDDRVSREETDSLFANLKGAKTLRTYPKEGHNFFTTTNQAKWMEDVSAFLQSIGSH